MSVQLWERVRTPEFELETKRMPVVGTALQGAKLKIVGKMQKPLTLHHELGYISGLTMTKNKIRLDLGTGQLRIPRLPLRITRPQIASLPDVNMAHALRTTTIPPGMQAHISVTSPTAPRRPVGEAIINIVDGRCIHQLECIPN